MWYGPSYRIVKEFDTKYNATWLKQIEVVCCKHTIKGETGPFCQFRTDWINEGLPFAVTQTLRYVGFGYVDDMIFRDIGAVIGGMIKDLESKGVKY